MPAAVAARAIHKSSARSGRPFVAITCDGLPTLVLESELFGHRRNAFPGALRDMAGALERADDGTLFIGRVDVFPHRLALRLATALTTGTAMRLGDLERRFSVRTRVICSSPHHPERSTGPMTDLMRFLTPTIISPFDGY